MPGAPLLIRSNGTPRAASAFSTRERDPGRGRWRRGRGRRRRGRPTGHRGRPRSRRGGEMTKRAHVERVRLGRSARRVEGEVVGAGLGGDARRRRLRLGGRGEARPRTKVDDVDRRVGRPGERHRPVRSPPPRPRAIAWQHGSVVTCHHAEAPRRPRRRSGPGPRSGPGASRRARPGPASPRRCAVGRAGSRTP